jgi:hypothetical protein
MRVDSSGENQFAGCVYCGIGTDSKVLSDCLHRFTVNQYIGYIIGIGGNDPPVFNQ